MWDAFDAIADGFDVQGFSAAGDRKLDHGTSTAPIEDNWSEGIDWTTEDGLATAFTRRYGEDWRYCAQWGKWLVKGSAFAGIRTSCSTSSTCRATSAGQRPSRPRRHVCACVWPVRPPSVRERIARSDPKHASMATTGMPDVWLLNTHGGVVDLRSGVMRTHDRADRMTKVCTAVPQRWLPPNLAIPGG